MGICPKTLQMRFPDWGQWLLFYPAPFEPASRPSVKPRHPHERESPGFTAPPKTQTPGPADAEPGVSSSAGYGWDQFFELSTRSEESRVRKECVSKCSTLCSQ